MTSGQETAQSALFPAPGAVRKDPMFGEQGQECVPLGRIERGRAEPGEIRAPKCKSESKPTWVRFRVSLAIE